MVVTSTYLDGACVTQTRVSTRDENTVGCPVHAHDTLVVGGLRERDGRRLGATAAVAHFVTPAEKYAI